VAFSDRTDRSIREFARSMGLTLNAGPQKAYGFKFPRLGNFIIALAPQQRVVASLIFRVEPWQEDLVEQLFAAAKPFSTVGHAPSVGVTGKNDVVLSVGMDDDEVTPQLLDQCLQQLLALRQSAVNR
jgi:hypothetical protein